MSLHGGIFTSRDYEEILFMLVFSVVWAVAGAFAVVVYFGHGEHDNVIFCMVCALGNVMCGCVWHFRIVNKK